MTAMILTLIGSAGVGAIVTAVLLHLRESPKAKADTAATLASTALAIVEKLEDRVTVLESRDLAATAYIAVLRQHIEAGNPPPPPDWPEILKSIA